MLCANASTDFACFFFGFSGTFFFSSFAREFLLLFLLKVKKKDWNGSLEKKIVYSLFQRMKQQNESIKLQCKKMRNDAWSVIHFKKLQRTFTFFFHLQNARGKHTKLIHGINETDLIWTDINPRLSFTSPWNFQVLFMKWCEWFWVFF